MPACCRAPVDHEPPAAGRPAPSSPPTARSALPTLWLAVAFQPACGTIWLGTLLSSSSTVQKLGAVLGLGPDPRDVGRRHERRLVAEGVADERRDRRDPLVVVAAHRDHHVRVGGAVDRPGEAVQHGLDHVVLVREHARRSGERRRHRRPGRRAGERLAVAVLAVARVAQLGVDALALLHRRLRARPTAGGSRRPRRSSCGGRSIRSPSSLTPRALVAACAPSTSLAMSGTFCRLSVSSAWMTTLASPSLTRSRTSASIVLSPALVSDSLARIAWTRICGLTSFISSRTSGRRRACRGPSSVHSAWKRPTRLLPFFASSVSAGTTDASCRSTSVRCAVSRHQPFACDR